MTPRNNRKQTGNHTQPQSGYSGSPQVGGFKPAFSPSSTRGSVGSKEFNMGKASTGQASDHSRGSAKYSVKASKKKRGRGKKIALVVCLVLAMLLIGGGVAVAKYIDSLNAEMTIEDPEEAQAIEAALTPTVSNEPFYAMIIGSDTRNDDEGARSDTNIVARVDLQSGTITLISIPRDTAINLEGYGTVKFNAAYDAGGAAGAIKAAEQLLGIKISHYAEVDFDGVVNLVDAMGGVTVDVPMAIEDADAGGSVPQGTQTLDGEHALIFARSRSYVSGDFQRTTCQRLLVEAMMNKVMTMPATDLPGVITQAAKCVTTDMKVTDIIGYAQSFQKLGKVTMYSAMVPSTTAEQNSVSYVVCDTKTLKKMMEVVEAGGDPSTVTTDTTVSSSQEAKAEGAEATPVYVQTP